MQIIVSASPLGALMTTRLAPAGQVLGGVAAGGEEAGRLDHDVDAVVAPRDLVRLTGLELLDGRAVDREAVAGLGDLVGQDPAHGVVLQQERHGVGVAEGVVDRHQLHPGVGAPGEQRPREGPTDPAEAVDPNPYRHDPSMPGRRCPVPAGPTARIVDHSRNCGSSSRLRTEAEPRAPTPVWPVRGPSRRVGRPRPGALDPERGQRGRIQRPARLRGSTTTRSTRIPASSTARTWSATSRPRVSGTCGPQVDDGDDRCPGRDERGVDVGGGERGQEAGEERSGGEHDLVGRLDGGRRPPAATARRAGRARCAGSGRASSAPRPGPRPRRRRPSALSTTGSDVAGRTRPTMPRVRPAIVERLRPVAGDLGEADEDEVAERVAVELACGEAMVERPGPDAFVRRRRRRPRARRGTCAGRRHRARRGRGGAGRWSHRRRRRSPPR